MVLVWCLFCCESQVKLIDKSEDGRCGVGLDKEEEVYMCVKLCEVIIERNTLDIKFNIYAYACMCRYPLSTVDILLPKLTVRRQKIVLFT